MHVTVCVGIIKTNLEMSGWYELVEGVPLGTGDRQHAPAWYILTTLTTVSLVRAMKRRSHGDFDHIAETRQVVLISYQAGVSMCDHGRTKCTPQCPWHHMALA